jgi:branched-chain amino acid transport system ATP-binding protein
VSDGALLEVRDLHVVYGKIEAVRGVSFSVRSGEVATLIGSNGAGKTTTLRTVSGLLRPAAGAVLFEGERLDGRPAHEIVERGIAQVPEGRRVFPRMTVGENLELGGFTRRGDEVEAERSKVYELFPVLAERVDQPAGTLSGGEQQMLAIGRALMSGPRLLMLDEPSMGLSPVMMERIFATLADLKQAGTTLLLVEQNAQAALTLADTGYVLESGELVLSDTAHRLMDDDRLRKAYLGE